MIKLSQFCFFLCTLLVCSCKPALQSKPYFGQPELSISIDSFGNLIAPSSNFNMNTSYEQQANFGNSLSVNYLRFNFISEALPHDSLTDDKLLRLSRKYVSNLDSFDRIKVIVNSGVSVSFEKLVDIK